MTDIHAIQASRGGGVIADALASPRARTAALTLDLSICALAFVPLSQLAIRWELGRAVGSWFGRPPFADAMVGGTVLAVLATLYFLVTESLNGTTIGKRLCGIEVRRSDGRRCDALAALVRTLLRPIDLIVGPPMLLATARRQRLGDRIADTVVMRRNRAGTVARR